jgi:hypothetical protein
MKKYHRKWYKLHKKLHGLRNRKYAVVHQTEITEYKRSWYTKHHALCLKRSKRRYKRTKNTDRRVYLLQKLYGLSVEAYKKLFEKQKGLCAICDQSSKMKLAVDHCHLTKKVRGLLCNPCNLALGIFKDDITRLQRAIFYLRGLK